MAKEQTAQEELKGLLLEIKGGSDALKAEMEAMKETQAKAFEDNKDLRDIVSKLDELPAKKVDIEVPGENKTVEAEIYKGYRIKDQGLELVTNISLPEAQREGHAKAFINVVKAAMTEGTAGYGGYLVPDELGDSIVAFSRLTSVALQDCNVVPMGSDTLRIPAESGAVSVDWANEESANSESEPTWAEIALTAKRMGAYSVASKELLADSRFDIVSSLTSMFGEGVGQEIDAQVFSSATSQQFTGIQGGAGYTVTLAASGASISTTNLSEAISNLSSNKLAGAKFYMNKGLIHYVRLLTDDNGHPIFNMPNVGMPQGIYGYPVVDVEKIPSPSSCTSGDLLGVFGNLKHYIIGRRDGNMSLLANPWILAKEHQMQFILATRWDGDIGLANGLVEIVAAAK